MSRHGVLTLPFLVLIVLSLFLGCGTKQSVICGLPASSASTCSCGGGACPAEFYSYVYVAGGSGGNNEIAAFPINLSTGAIGTPVTSTGPGIPSMAVVENAFLYASDPYIGPVLGGGAIYGWTINTETGALTAVPESPFILQEIALPNGVAVADNLASGPYLYVADGGVIDGLQINSATGALTAVPGSPFTSGTNIYLAVDYLNHFVFATDEDSPGGLLAFTIDASTGALTPVPGSPFAINSGSTGFMQLGQIVVDPTGRFVYVAVTATNQVAAFAITASSGVLTPAPGSPFAAGDGASAMTTFNNSPGNNFLYVANTTAGTISGYSINPTSGALSPLAGSPFAISATALVTDISGGHLYASSATDVMAFSIDPSTGGLTQIGSPVAFPGATALTYEGR